VRHRLDLVPVRAPATVPAFQGWQPLQDPSFGWGTMSSWKDLLEADQPYDFSHGAASMAPYTQLVSEVIVPAVRIAGTNSWDASDPEPTLQLLLTWEHVLPPVVLQSILEHVVMPKLSATVESWDPCEEKVPIHVWVHPWLGMLERRSVQIPCHSIRYKMSSALHAWQVHHKSDHTPQSPWKNVFGSAIWNDLVARYIVPKLRMALQEFQINPSPADQKLDQFDWVASEIRVLFS
jgi:tuftelin-interacting protein 11